MMGTFPDGTVIHRDFDSFDEMAAVFPAWGLEASAIGPGRFASRLDLAATAEMQLLRLTVGTPLLVTGLSPAGAGGAVLHLRAQGGIRSRGRSIDPFLSAPARLRQSEVHYLSNGPVDLVLIAFDAALLRRHLCSRSLRTAERMGADWLLRPSPGAAALPERGHAIRGLLRALTSGAVASGEAKHRLQECALHILLDGLDGEGAADRAVSFTTRLRMARAAEAMLRARLDDPPSLSELCHLLAIPERTLHAAFQEGFGMAPKAYLRALRLSAAHRRLSRGIGTVTEMATGLGFFHFGRFSGEYRSMFGEPPSETLRRARGPGAA